MVLHTRPYSASSHLAVSGQLKDFDELVLSHGFNESFRYANLKCGRGQWLILSFH